MTDVDVSVEESPDQTPIVVIPTASDDSATLLPIVTELVEKVTRLESALAQTNDTVESVATEVVMAEVVAENAQDTADFAVEIASDAQQTAIDATELVLETAVQTDVLDTVLEETDTDVIPDSTPHSTHWLFRGLDEWKRKISA